MPKYHIDFDYGNDSYSEAQARNPATPWKSRGSYLVKRFNDASFVDDVIVCTGLEIPSITEPGLGTGSYGMAQRIFSFLGDNGLTPKTAGSKFIARQWVESDGPTPAPGGAIRPAVIQPFMPIPGATANLVTVSGGIVTHDADIVFHATADRVGRVCFRPFDIAGINPTGLPGLDFRRAMPQVANASDSGALTAAIAATNDEGGGNTGIPVSTFVYNPTTKHILININDAANGGGSALASLNTTRGNWYYSVSKANGSLDSVCGWGYQCNPTTGAGWGSKITGMTGYGFMGEVGTGHTFAIFDAAYGEISGNKIMLAGSHAIGISNTAGVAVSEMIIEGNVVEGMAGGKGQGNSAILLGGGGWGGSINGARIRNNDITLFNPINAAGVPSAASSLVPFALLAGLATDALVVSGGSGSFAVGDAVTAAAGSGTLRLIETIGGTTTFYVSRASGSAAFSSSGTLNGQAGATRTISSRASASLRFAGVKDMLFKRNVVRWVPGLNAVGGATVSSLYSPTGARTHIFGSASNCIAASDTFDWSSHPIRFDECTFLGMAQNRLDALNRDDMISVAFRNSTLLCDDYVKRSAFQATYGGEGAFNLGDGGRDFDATVGNSFHFENCALSANMAMPTGSTATCAMFDQSVASTRATSFTHQLSFKNCTIVAKNPRRTTGSSEFRFFTWGDASKDDYGNGLRLRAEGNTFAFESPIPNEGSGGGARYFMRRDTLVTALSSVLVGNAYYGMAPSTMSQRSGIANLRGNFKSGSGGDATAKIVGNLGGPLYMTLPLGRASGSEAAQLEVGAKPVATGSANGNVRDPFGLRP